MKKLLFWLMLVPCLVFGQTSNYHTLNRGVVHDIITDIAIGIVPNTSLVTVFGYYPNVDSGASNVNLWELGTAWSILTSASTMELLSSSANDTAAGTGCRTVLTQGLDANYNQIQETTNTNGTSAVALSNSYLVINASTCIVDGSGNVNAGNITTRVTSAGATQAYIATGAGASHLGRYTVPAGYTLVLKNFFTQANKAGNQSISANVNAVIVLPGGNLIQGLPQTIVNGSNPTITVPTGAALTEKQTFEFQIASVSSTGINVGAGASGILIKNP